MEKVPAFDEMMQPLIDVLKQRESEATIKQLNDEVATLMHLSPAQRAVLLKADGSDKRSRFEYNLGWTRTYLRLTGYVDSVRRGTWALTEKGKTVDKLDVESIKMDVKKLNAKANKNEKDNSSETMLQPSTVPSTEQGFFYNSIFLSYRRTDSIGTVGRIRDWLKPHFGKEAIYRDLDSIPLGVDFRKHLRNAVQECQVLVAVVGPRWLTVEDSRGHHRLDDPADFVRIEIEAALQRDIPIIPVIVEGATMPRDFELPESLQSLAFYNGLSVRHDPDFEDDMATLIAGLEKLLKA